MAQDEGRREQWRDRGDDGPDWRGDEGFGGGWGNQVPRPHRMGARDNGGVRVDAGEGPLHRAGTTQGYGARDWYGPDTARGDHLFGGPGIAGDRPDRADFARAGGSGSGRGASIGAGGTFRTSARDFDVSGESRTDPHYAEWRQRRMAEFDRDFDEYRSENQSRFDREFGAWRERRGEQRAAVARVREHMAVVGSDGGHVGKVDCTRGDRVILTRSDEAAGGVHHAIPCAWIDNVDDKVVLNIEAEEARRRWQTEDRSRALFEREHVGRRGPHVLNRSFAGTYPDEE